MKFQARTVFLLVGLSIILSSIATYIVIGMNPNQEGLPQLSQAEDITKSDGKKSTGNVEEKFNKIAEAYKVISENYVLEVDEEKLLEGAIEGMLNTLEDPYSVYMDPEAAEQFKSSLQSSFEGIGAEVMIQNGRVTIVAPIRNAPAEKAGLRPNDQILSVNGENIEGLDLYKAVLKIRGPKNTEAVLEIARPGVTDPITITVIRDEIPLETVYSETMKVNGKTFGKIQITSFAASTAQDFATALTSLEKAGMAGLVIDVRGNPGGYLDAVREIGKLIVPNESIITEIQSRTGQKAVYRSTFKGKKEYPITILVDNGSASASEILAAALQEAGNYKVVGKTTFGKGTVQSTVELKDSSEIKITIAKWLTPKENWIHQKGVQPDIEVEQPDYFKAVPIQAEQPLTRDMNSEQVKNLQVILRGLGYDPGRGDGFYSPETEVAVKSFQAKNNLKATGQVDEKTASLLQEQLIEVIKNPQNDLQLQKALEVLVKEIR
ncbi:S41 family peptidase [Caldalkalibacillus mannanilyticus]|uniref:S41 family peptidase n=1 Tax=Caldalkalibacillus mannanilyticus TaxID=1418 RepID=UPI000467F692|nr:S41 family peptidase [Caldalkalibacillus mannanilyticus]